MKSKGLEILIIIFIASLLLIIPVVILSQVEDIETRGLCVDGRGNENLDGKMCAIEYQSLFGLDAFNSSMLIFMFLSMTCFIIFISIILIISIILKPKNREVKK